LTNIWDTRRDKKDTRDDKRWRWQIEREREREREIDRERKRERDRRPGV